jgi:hypothetical protein
VWQGAENQRAAVEVRIVVSDEAHFLTPQACALALSFVGAGELETKTGMVRDEAAQLAAGVTGRAKHPDGKFMHGE